MKPGTRVIHKRLGKGTVQEYLDFDGTTERSTKLKEVGSIYIALDDPPEGFTKVVQVDIEALTALDEQSI